MNLFFCDNLTTTTVTLTKEESKHCALVLRKKIGDSVFLFDGKGTKAKGKINKIEKKIVQVAIENREFTPPDSYFLHLAVTPTKQINKTEWLIEKAIEFGVHEISFITTKRSERKQLNFQRMQKIVLSAAKQSLAAYLPKLNNIEPFTKFITNKQLPKRRFIATLHTTSSNLHILPNEKLVAMVGPEGGFTDKEIELAISSDFEPVLLGKKRLRTETAALFFSSIMYQLQIE